MALYATLSAAASKSQTNLPNINEWNIHTSRSRVCKAYPLASSAELSAVVPVYFRRHHEQLDERSARNQTNERSGITDCIYPREDGTYRSSHRNTRDSVVGRWEITTHPFPFESVSGVESCEERIYDYYRHTRVRLCDERESWWRTFSIDHVDGGCIQCIW